MSLLPCFSSLVGKIIECFSKNIVDTKFMLSNEWNRFVETTSIQVPVCFVIVINKAQKNFRIKFSEPAAFLTVISLQVASESFDIEIVVNLLFCGQPHYPGLFARSDNAEQETSASLFLAVLSESHQLLLYEDFIAVYFRNLCQLFYYHTDPQHNCQQTMHTCHHPKIYQLSFIYQSNETTNNPDTL